MKRIRRKAGAIWQAQHKSTPEGVALLARIAEAKSAQGKNAPSASDADE